MVGEPHFTVDRFLRLCPQANRTIVQQIAPVFEQEAANYGVTSLMRRSHLMGQLAHESGGFARLVENLSYSATRICQVWPRLCPRAANLAHNPEALGNAAYGGKNGNGPESSGDGWAYRGRGLIQLTGRGNYRDVGPLVHLSLEAQPALAETAANSVLIAFAFWKRGNCNQHADLDDVRAVTLAINGGVNGLSDRIELTNRAKGIFV